MPSEKIFSNPRRRARGCGCAAPELAPNATAIPTIPTASAKTAVNSPERLMTPLTATRCRTLLLTHRRLPNLLARFQGGGCNPRVFPRFGTKADIARLSSNVRFWHKADIPRLSSDKGGSKKAASKKIADTEEVSLLRFQN